jgi:hypothetical protein
MNTITNVVIISFIIFLSLLLIFLFRHDLFKPSEDQQQFGSYGLEQSTACYNSTGRCSDTGVSIVTQNCIPNSNTGFGCIGSDGKQTFSSKTTVTPCSLSCRSQVWQINDISPCLYNDENLTCIPPSLQGLQTITQTCLPNDSTGPNMCLLEVDPYTTDIPSTCTPSINFPNLIECNIETTIITTVNCVPSQYEKPLCGVWGVRDIININTDNPQYSNATSQCYNGVISVPSSECYAADGRKYSLDSDILKPGFNTQPMQCFNQLNPDASGYSNSLLPGDAICSSYPGCITGGEIESINNGNNTTVRCQDLNNPTVPGCIDLCVYIPPNLAPISNWLPEFKYLFGAYFYIQQNNNFLSLRYTPCPTIADNSYYPAGVSTASGIPFNDCLAVTGTQLENFVNVVSIDSLQAQNNSNLYQIKNGCLSDTITINSSLLLFFKPRAIQTNVNQYRCCILAVLGKSWVGYLTYRNNQLGWTPAAVAVFDLVGTTDETADTFIITYTSSGYNIYYESNNNLISLSVPKMYPSGYSGSLDLINLSIISPSYGGVPINTITNVTNRFNALNNLLNLKQTRLDPSTCNLYYHTTILPANYPNPDISTPDPF